MRIPLLALALAGCASLTTAQSPRLLAPGEWQVSAEPSYLITRSELSGDSVLVPALGVRYGLDERIELGLRGGGARPEVGAKIRLGERAAFWASLGGFPYGGARPSVQLYSQPTLLWGLGDLVLAPKVDVTAGWTRDTETWGLALTPALSVGYLVRVGWLGVMPEIAAGWTALHLGTGGPVVGGGFALQAGLAVMVP